MISEEGIGRTSEGISKSIIIFAYGSNMCSGRFRDYSVTPEQLARPAVLVDYRLRINKPSRDMSAKANIEPHTGDKVWGVLYSIPDTQLASVDRGEGNGYSRKQLTVQTPDGKTTPAWVYIAQNPSSDPALLPYEWYKRFIVEGAREHGLPFTYIEHLRAIKSIEDPDKNRDRKKRALICQDCALPEFYSRRSAERSPEDYGADLKIGIKDSSGRKIRRIHARESGRYTIYETTDNQIVIKGQVLLANVPELNRLLTKIGDLVSNAPSLGKKYNASRAHAMKVFMDGDSETSSCLFQDVFDDMARYLTRRAKIAYQLGAAILMLLSLIALPVASAFGTFDQLGARLCYAVILSSMGGFLSVAIGADKLKVDLQNSHFVNMLYGGLRILIAIISGIIVVFFIEAKIVLSFLKDTSNVSGFIIAAFFAGFSEKLVPNLMHKIDRGSE
jgi:gamma-glutamylcyclotransferase